MSGSVNALGSVFGTRGAGSPRAGLFARWPSRHAQRKNERSVERWRASERFESFARWSAARYERTASVSSRESGVLPELSLANSRSQKATKRSRSERYARTVCGENRRSSAT